MPTQTQRVEYVIHAGDSRNTDFIAATTQLYIAEWIAQGRSLLRNNRGVIYTIHGPNGYTKQFREGREFPL